MSILFRHENGTENENIPLDLKERFQSKFQDGGYKGWNRGGEDNANAAKSPFSPVEDENAIIVRKWGHMRAKFKESRI